MRRDRIRTAFGPLIVGVIGGAVIGSAILTDSIWTGVAHTEQHFPRYVRPTVTDDFTMNVLGFILRYITPLVIGLVTAWFVRTRDRIEDISAGTTAGLTAAFVAFIGVIGWQATIAHTVVPSLPELTILANAANPIDVSKLDPSSSLIPEKTPTLAETYPGIEAASPRERANALVAKFTADQVRGTRRGFLTGGLLALISVGCVCLLGTMSGGWLRRQPISSVAIVGLYAEMMIPATMTILSDCRLLNFDVTTTEYTFNAILTLTCGVWFYLTLSGASFVQRAIVGLFWLLLVFMVNRLEISSMLMLATFMGIGLAAIRNRPQSKNGQRLKLAVS